MTAQSILLTRPAAASARFADALRLVLGKDAPIVISPLMAPVFLCPALPAGTFDAIILTSETGAEAARRISAEQGNLPLRAFCVGDRTAQIASEAGFDACSAKGSADDLVRLIRTQNGLGRFLHLRGLESRGDIAKTLTKGGLETVQAIVYDQRPCPLTAEASGLLSDSAPVIVPLFSPRSADLLALNGPFTAPLWLVAISAAVAGQAHYLTPTQLVVSDRPDADAMVRAVHNLWLAGRRT